MFRKTIAILYIVAVATTSSALQLFFPELHRQYNYVIKTNVSTGTLTPETSCSYWTMEGRLAVQVYGNFTRARFRLDNLRTSVYSVNEGYSTYQSKEDTLHLQKPWEADFDSSGFVRYLYVIEEPAWTTNMKRALTINFQLKRDTQSYGTEEPSFYSYPGSGATYLVKGKTIRKYTTYAPTLVNSWSSVPESGRQVNGHTKPDKVTTAERVYELDDRKGLLSLDLRGEFQYKIHEHVLSVVSELSLYYDTDLPLQHVEELNLTQTSVFYQFHGYSNPTNGIRNNSQRILKNRTYQILMKIAKTGIDAANVVRNASLIHSMDFVDLLTTMSQLNYTSLGKLFEDMVLGTSYDVETARNIFLEVLPHVKTDACAKFVKYLVLEQKEKVEDATILSLIRKLPFNVANHSQALLEELEVFTKLGPDFSQDIRHAGILSFATMVHKALEAWSLKQDYFDIIVVKYFRMYSDCPQYVDRMIWLLGLSNIGFSAEYTRTIYGDSNKARHERLWAALASTGRQNSALETTLPILIDDKEHIQLRIAALHVFLSSQMEASDFLYVHNYIKTCDNNQLKRFWYTTLKSLEKSTYREYRTASYYVPFVANQISNPDSTYWATNNYIISTKDDKATLHLLSVGEAMSAVPAFIALKLFTGERRSFQIAAYIIAEGVSINMFRKLHTLDNMEINVDHLIELLKKMKVEIKEEEKVHIDIVIKIQDKTVYATHVNESRFETWNGEDLSKSIEDFLRFGSHINQQFVYYPSQVDINLPTELGTPIRLQSATVSFTSIRGNLTAPSTQDLTWKNDLHIRYQGTSVTSLSTDGPLLQSEHSARIQQSVVAHIPLNFDVTVSTVAASFALTWKDPGAQNGGVAMHSRAQIITDSDKGRDSYTLTAGDKTAFADGNGIFFDCERPMSAMELVERLLISNSNSNEILTSLHPTQILLNAFVLLSSPHPGSCGLVVGSRLEENGILKLELQLEELTKDLRDGGRIKIGHKLSFSDTNETHTNVKFNITGTTQFQSEDGKTTFEFLLVGHHQDASDASSHIWKLCLQQEDITHASPDQDITTDPASYEGHLSLTFGRNDSTLTCPAVGSEFLVFYKGIPTQVYGELERYFELKMVGKELPQLELLSKTGLGKTAFGQLLSTMDARVPNVTAIVNEKNGVATISVNHGEDLQFKSEHFAWLFDSWSNMQLMKKFGFYRECRLQESTVQTLYGSTEQLTDVQCAESLALADCTKSPRFAVIRLKHGGIRIYAGSTQVVLKGGSGDVQVTIDDKACTGDCVYPADEPLYDFKISRMGDGVKVISRLSRIQVYYSQSETVILMPHAYMSSACGSCAGENSYQIC